MTSSWPLPPAPSAHVQAIALSAAFPGYVVSVIRHPGDRPRYEVVARDAGTSPYALISTDAREIWRELKGRPPS
jgi:hypothetical protein